MHDAVVHVPDPINEPILGYAPGSAEKARLKAALADIEREVIEIPCVVGGQRVTTGKIREVVMPHRHRHVVARFHAAEPDTAERAIRAALEARKEWSAMRWEARAACLLRAAELLAGPWRMRINAATMHGQSKTCHQAEIDAACEMIDFWRFNVSYAQQLYQMQPKSAPGMWNMSELRPLEGFVFALTPFNFTAIGGNLPTAPALMGNTVVWKPAESQLLAAWRSREHDALDRIRRQHPKFEAADDAAVAAGPFRLSDAQLVIAREYGLKHWTELKQRFDANTLAFVDGPTLADGRGEATAVGLGDGRVLVAGGWNGTKLLDEVLLLVARSTSPRYEVQEDFHLKLAEGRMLGLGASLDENRAVITGGYTSRPTGAYHAGATNVTDVVDIDKREVVRAATSITREGLSDMRNKLDELKRLAEDVQGDVQDAIAVNADVARPQKAEARAATPGEPTPSPFNLGRH